MAAVAMWLSPLCQLGRPFFVLLLAENIFVAGANIAVFAIGAWVYQQSNSLFDFSLVATAGALSTLAVLPFAGALADRFDRRKAILWSDAGVLCLMGVLLWVMAKNGAALWLLYVFSVIVALAHALRTPAYRTTMSALLQSEQMPLACGLMGIVNGLVGIGVPIIAGMLMYRYGLDGIFMFNLVAIACSLLLAAAALYRVPSSLLNSSATAGTGANVGGLLRDLSRAIAYFREYRLMAFLLAYVLVQECLEALVSTLITPLILTGHSVRELGAILSWGGLGAALGAVPLLASRLASRLALLLLVCNMLLSLCVVIASLVNTTVYYAASVFVALFSASLATCCAMALWMRKVPLDRQGSVFALMGSLAVIPMPITVLLADSVVDRWLLPAFTTGASWTLTASLWLGSGKDDGALRLVLLCCGVLGGAISLAGLAHRTMRCLDDHMLDAR